MAYRNTIDPHDLTTLPEPHAWATWVKTRAEPYKTHSSLGIAKNALSYFYNGDVLKEEAFIFEWDGYKWTVAFHLPQGTDRRIHPLYKAKSTKKGAIKGPSDKQIEDAIASIRRSTEGAQQ